MSIRSVYYCWLYVMYSFHIVIITGRDGLFTLFFPFLLLAAPLDSFAILPRTLNVIPTNISFNEHSNDEKCVCVCVCIDCVMCDQRFFTNVREKEFAGKSNGKIKVWKMLHNKMPFPF